MPKSEVVSGVDGEEALPPSHLTEDRPLAARIYALATSLRRSAGESFKRSLGLSSTEWPIVATLSVGPASFATLCDRLSRDKGQLSRDVAALVERGFLVKRRDGRDQRQLVLDLNRENAAFVEEVLRISHQRDGILWDGINQVEKEILLRLLSKLYDHARSSRIFEV